MTIPKINSHNGGLITQEQRHNFINPPNLLGWLDSNPNNIQSSGSVYNTDDLRVKNHHWGILTIIVTDLQLFSIGDRSWSWF